MKEVRKFYLNDGVFFSFFCYCIYNNCIVCGMYMYVYVCTVFYYFVHVAICMYCTVVYYLCAPVRKNGLCRLLQGKL